MSRMTPRFLYAWVALALTLSTTAAAQQEEHAPAGKALDAPAQEEEHAPAQQALDGPDQREPHGPDGQAPHVPAGIPVYVTIGIASDGTANDAWISAIRIWHGDDALRHIVQDQHVLTSEERKWITLIRSRIRSWSAMTDSLRVPFGDTVPPDAVHIVVGNVGGQDAFTFSDSTIGFDLSRLHALYGSATARENRGRIDRFFAHEFTHLMHKSWRKSHNVVLSTPLDRALWECLVEGFGNYRSLSSRWVRPDGHLTAHAREVLGGLQHVFVDRIAALEDATDGAADSLMAGLSTGPFDRKWGALSVALWLAQESQGDERRLRKWIDGGPAGVLTLARIYLPAELREELPSPRE